LEVLFKYIVEMPRNETVTLVIFVPPGQLFSNVIIALHALENVQIHVEFGIYGRKDNLTQSGKYFLNENEKESIIFAGISQEDKPEWKDIFPKSMEASWNLISEGKKVDLDFMTGNWKTPKSNIPNEESVDKKKSRSEHESWMTYKLKAPRYTMCAEQGGLVNPECKPARILMDIINRFFST